MSYISHINKYASSQAIQDAVNNGTLANPYVAINDDTGLLDWNMKVKFDVDADDMEFPGSGGTSAITITASQDWTITLPAWLSASTLSGNSSQEVTVSATTTQQAHEGTISVSAATTSVTINVEQAEPVIDYSTMYFTVEMLEAGSFMNNKWLVYSINGGEWIDPEGAYEEIENLNQGDTIRFKTPENGLYDGLVDAFANNTTAAFNVYGNIMSLICGDTFANATDAGNNTFEYLFNYSALNSAEHLVLPATTLAEGCYSSMFENCTSLTSAPSILPATILTDGCYEYMFMGCASLTTAPELPATTLADSCYRYMFHGCTSLTTAPELPATTLADECYGGMFHGCTSLTTAPELPATTLADYCYMNMFDGCYGIETAPVLPALTLEVSCYNCMFFDCGSLMNVTCLATDISATSCLSDWLKGASFVGTLHKNPLATSIWLPGTNIPDEWTVQDYSA